MSGIYGNSAEDRYFERKLNDYLEEDIDVSDDIEITADEVQVILDCIGNMPAHFDAKNDLIDGLCDGEEKTYRKLMKLYERLYEEVA